MNILENLKNLNISEKCYKEIITLIEGEIIDFQKKRKEIILDRNAHKLANMIRNGELDGLRTTTSGELIGDPIALKKVKDIEKENKEVGLGRKVGLEANG